MTIKVLLMISSPIYSDALKLLIGSKPGFEVEVGGDNSLDVFRMIRNIKPNVVLIDLENFKEKGFEAIKVSRKSCSNVKIVTLIWPGQQEYLLEAVKAGANGYCFKNGSTDELFDAITRAAMGQNFFDSKLAGQILDEIAAMAEGNRSDSFSTSLTIREIEILKMVAQGYTNKEVAKRVYLSSGTVKNHLSNIYSKLHCDNRAQAVNKAIKQGLCKCLEQKEEDRHNTII